MNTHDPIATLPHGSTTLDHDRRDFLLKSAAGMTVFAAAGPAARG